MHSTSRLKYLFSTVSTMLTWVPNAEQNAPLGILMGRADHLWEINDNWIAGITADEDVELVEVAMDKASLCQADNDVHELRV